MNLKQVTIVTGGGRGIGRAIANRMAQRTAVLVVGRTGADLESVCNEINQHSGSADFVIGDVADESTAAAAIAKINEHGWTIRNLVCNAGIGKGGPIVSFDSATWRQMFQVNVDGAFFFIKACLPTLIEKKGGSISIISSISGLKGHKNDGAYSATKFALVGLAQSLADEVKKHNIGVFPICPGFVESDMTRRTIAGLMTYQGKSKAEAEQRIARANAQGRILQPEEVAEVVAYCSTDAALAVSGQSLDLTGWSEPRFLQLVNWVYDNAGAAKQLLIPVSGGTDSALNFAACARAYPGKAVGVYVGSRDKLRCRDWFESVGQMTYIDPIAFPGNAEIARWAQFLELSNSSDAWLVGSRNRTEEFTGLYSLASRVATFLPLANVWKTEVMELCTHLGVPAEVVASSRRADPDCGRPKELAEIPLELIDLYLKVCNGVLAQPALANLTADQITYLDHVVELNRFKQYLPTKGPLLFQASVV